MKNSKVPSKLKAYKKYVDNAKACYNSTILSIVAVIALDAGALAITLLSDGVASSAAATMVAGSFDISSNAASQIVAGENNVIKAGKAYNAVKGYGKKL